MLRCDYYWQQLSVSSLYRQVRRNLYVKAVEGMFPSYILTHGQNDIFPGYLRHSFLFPNMCCQVKIKKFLKKNNAKTNTGSRKSRQNEMTFFINYWKILLLCVLFKFSPTR